MKKKIGTTCEQTMHMDKSRKITVFWEEGFPAIDTVIATQASFANALAGYDVQFAGADALGRELETSDLLVMPYGSAFPKSAWIAIHNYLRSGGNWLNLGGNPFARPVRCEGGQWKIEIPQRAYAKELLINHAFAVDVSADATLEGAAAQIDLGDLSELAFRRVWTLQVRLSETGQKDFPDEQGTSGRRNGLIQPLLRATLDGRVIAVPIVAIDRIAGVGRGGRWVFVNVETKKPFSAGLIRCLANYALAPQIRIEARPSFACYYGNEQAAVTLQVDAPPMDLSLTVEAVRDGQAIHTSQFDVTVGSGPVIVTTPPFVLPDKGLYSIRAVACRADAKDAAPLATAMNGFWSYDEQLLARAGRLTVNRDYFVRDGQTVPITGTTYMSGDKHRKFLFEPNAAVWDADFAAMRAAGVGGREMAGPLAVICVKP